MKFLFVGGTGNISGAVTRQALAAGHEVWHLNRGQRGEAAGAGGVRTLVADVKDAAAAAAVLAGHTFDAVVDFIAFGPEDVRRDLALFRGRCGQFVFISSASAYQKPLLHPVITESTPLKNPFWEYSRQKIAAEELLNQAYREEDFPITIVRPSLTYDTVFPVALGGWGCFTWVDRVRRGRPVIVHGDGLSLWTITHSEDLARGLVGLLGHAQALGHAFHITSDEALTWDQLYLTMARTAGVEPKLVHLPSDFIARVMPEKAGSLLGDKAYSAVFDNTKIKTFVPGYRAQIPFRTGIARTLRWFEADARRQRVDAAVDARLDHLLAAWERAMGA